MSVLQIILVPTDFSETSEVAVIYEGTVKLTKSGHDDP